MTIPLMPIILRKTTITHTAASIATTPKTTLEATAGKMETTIKTKTTLPSTTKTKKEHSSTYLTTTSVR